MEKLGEFSQLRKLSFFLCLLFIGKYRTRLVLLHKTWQTKSTQFLTLGPLTWQTLLIRIVQLIVMVDLRVHILYISETKYYEKEGIFASIVCSIIFFWKSLQRLMRDNSFSVVLTCSNKLFKNVQVCH